MSTPKITGSPGLPDRRTRSARPPLPAPDPTRRSLLPALLLALAGCEQAPADDPADAGPPPPECRAEGNWLLEYSAAEDGAGWRHPDVLVIDGAHAHLDTYGLLARHFRECPEATTEARWLDGSCTLALTHHADPCANGALRDALTATLRFGETPVGEAESWRWPDDEASTVAFTVTVTRLPDGAQCVLPEDPPAIPGPIFGDPIEAPGALTGAVEVAAIEPGDGEQTLRLRAVDGAELSVRVPSTVSLPAVGAMAWIDAEIDTPFWLESAFVLRHAEGGPLIAASLHGGHSYREPDWLTGGPWARAGITLRVAPACVAAWLPVECFTLTELQAVTVTAGGIEATALPGDVVAITPPGLGPARLAVAMARTDYAVDCTDYPERWLALGLVPAE